MSTTVQRVTSAASELSGVDTVASNGSSSKSDLFMRLLVAQIQNQDPLSPTEGKDFVQQFAAMTQVQSMESMASMTSASAAAQQSLLIVGLGGQVGSEVAVGANKVTLGDTPVRGGFTLSSTVNDANVVLTGSDGVEHRIALGPRQAGSVEFSINPNKLGLPAGSYTLQVQTSTGDKPDPEIYGQLLAVRVDKSGAVMLDVGGVGEVPTSGIVRFLGRSVTTSSSNQYSGA